MSQHPERVVKVYKDGQIESQFRIDRYMLRMDHETKTWTFEADILREPKKCTCGKDPA